MKSVFLIALLLVANNCLVAQNQNMIQNGSFETIVSGKTFINSQGNLDDCQNWSTVYGQSSSIPTCLPHSPDWINNDNVSSLVCNGFMKAYNGKFYVRAGDANFELFQQNIPIKRASNYFLSFMARTDSSIVFPSGTVYNNCNNSSGNLNQTVNNRKMAVYFSKEKIDFKNTDYCLPYNYYCSDIPSDFKNFKKPSSQAIKEVVFDYQVSELLSKNKWINFVANINDKDLNVYNYISFLPTIEGNNTCYDKIIYYDDMYLAKASCACPLELRIENKIYNWGYRLEQSSEKIVSGYDADVNTTNGDVIVKSSGNVEYRSGGYIELRPGFSTEAGAVFTAQIAPCTSKTGPIQVGLTNAFTPNGDGLNDNFVIPTINATDYRVKLYLPYGGSSQLVVDQDGQVPPDGLINVIFPSGFPCDGRNYITYIYLSNCDVDTLLNYSVTALGCPTGGVSAKKEVDSVVVNLQDAYEVKVYPNPFNGYVTIDLNNALPVFEKLEITDIMGKSVIEKSKKELDTESNTITIETNSLVAGSYILRLYLGSSYKNFKIFKQ